MLERPSLSELTSRIQADVETRLPEVGTFLRRSVLKVLTRVLAGSVHLLYGYADYQAQQMFASTADSAALNIIASEYGLTRTSATYATGNATASGTDGTVIPSGTYLQNSDGYIYTTNAAYTIGAAGVSGYETIYFTSQYGGEDYNDDGSVTLSFVSPITGVNSTVTVSAAGITGGADEEEDDDLRERILNRKRLPPHGGTSDDYVNWMKELSGVTRAWAYPQFMGNGTVGLAFVYDNASTVIPTGTQADTMLSYIEEHTDPASGETVGAPLGAVPGIFIMSSSGMIYSGGTNTNYVFSSLPVVLTIGLYPNTSTVQTNVLSEIQALILSDGGPGETIRLSRLTEAIGNAVGEEYHSIVYPTTDISATFAQLHTYSSSNITFQDYS